MATVNLLPDADVSNDWTLSTGSDVYALLDDDHAGLIGTDSSTLGATVINKVCTVTFQDFTEDHSSIDSVQVVIRAGNNTRGQTFALKTNILDVGTNLYTETSATQGASTTYRTVTYTSRTTSDGSTAWSNSVVNNLRLTVTVDAISGGTLSFTYCYFIVTYTEPSVVTDNAVFFGTNF